MHIPGLGAFDPRTPDSSRRWWTHRNSRSKNYFTQDLSLENVLLAQSEKKKPTVCMWGSPE